MRRVHLGGATFVTSDDIAASLLKYSTVLARHGKTDTVTVPIATDDGQRSTITCTLGTGPITLEDVATPKVSDNPNAASELDARRREQVNQTESPPDPASMDPWDL